MAAAEQGALMARNLYEQCAEATWFESSEFVNPSVLGVAVRQRNHELSFEPADSLDRWMVAAMRSIAQPVMFSMATEITTAILSQVSQYQNELLIQPRGVRMPVVESLASVPARAFEIRQSVACLVKKENVVLIWANSTSSAIATGSDVEQMLMEMVWGASFGSPRILSRPGTVTRIGSSLTLYNEKSPMSITPKSGHTVPSSRDGSKNEKGAIQVSTQEVAESVDENIYDPEAAKVVTAKRPMILTHSVMVGLATILLLVLMSLLIAQIVNEIAYDGKFTRVAFLAVLPIYAGFALGALLVVVISVFQIFSPVGDIMGNSRYHSAVAPNPKKFQGVELPHITVQIPVFKEGLAGVIVPTITSIMTAVRYYERVGGTASIFINDDGMQTIAADIAESRREFYAKNRIGWCARPGHGQDGFVRGGRFKKASNMNYCLAFSNRVEDELLRLIAQRQESMQGQGHHITLEEENELYQRALETTIEADEGRTMAAGNVRLGEIILLVDCDTRVPETSLHMGALEMLESSDVAIVQHTSGVLKVAHNIFEGGISYLTDLVYSAIRFNVGSGDCSCFVGHNAFLRWKAIQSVVFEEDGVSKVWSENHVSEDFHLSMRLQIAGFEIRLATYHGQEFKEGVSLTVFDELARWEKYSYGCNELVFNPLYRWYKGPITGLYLRYFWSNVKTSSKIMVLSYTFSYYAIAMALPLSLLNLLLVGWWPNTLDTFYVQSWKIFLVIIIIYQGISPVAYVILQWRLSQKSLKDALIQVLRSLPLMYLFFSGLSFHLLKSIFCHFFGIKIEWTATAKELESTGFFIGMDRVVNDFKYMYVCMIILTAGMIYLGCYAPVGWNITNWTCIVPLANQVICHSVLPIALGIF